jgi:DNA-3-methyladenine glycosylase II
MSNEERFSLSVVPPFRLDFTVWALRRRQKNLIDRWDGKQYSRAFIVEGKVLQVVVEQKTEAELAVIIKSNMQTDRIQLFVTKQVQKILGTDTNLEVVRDR